MTNTVRVLIADKMDPRAAAIFRERGIVVDEKPGLSPDELKAAIILFYGLLDEQQRRLFAGLESIRLGHGGDTLLGDFLGLDAHTVARGRQQLLDRNIVSGRTRRQGGGRQPAEKKRRT